jgi:prevent-host-death family protein
MRVASITEAKNTLSALLDRVRAGQSVLIVDRGVPVARLEPVPATGESSDAARLARLERAGLVRRGTAPPPLALIASPPPRPRKGASAVEALLEERRTGR